MKFIYLICFLVLSLLTPSIFAEPNLSANLDKTQTCAACHGINGISNNPEWPNLAGQHIEYLIKQLQDYKANKTRQEPTMYAFVSILNDNDIKDIAQYYASLKQSTCHNKFENLARGKKIYTHGDMSKHITACIACHGPDGSGNAQAGFPLLSGQNTNYTINQLKAFKENKRRNDINKIMRDISKHMSKDDIQAVAEYICSLKSS